jgi:hypothetical protein
MFGGELGAAEIGQLLGVDLDREAPWPWPQRRRARLLGREGDALAEHIDGIRQPLRRDGVEHRPGDEVDIAPERPLNSGGTAWAPRKVVRTSTGRSRPSRRATASCFSSASCSSP